MSNRFKVAFWAFFLSLYALIGMYGILKMHLEHGYSGSIFTTLLLVDVLMLISLWLVPWLQGTVFPNDFLAWRKRFFVLLLVSTAVIALDFYVLSAR